MNTDLGIWVSETQNNNYRLSYKVKETLYSKKSEFQQVDVVDTDFLGRTLFNDGLLMTCEKDEFVYHEMIAHVPLQVHPEPRKVLIIGGGDGGTAREVLKHSSVEEVVMVEIDPFVVEACKEHLHVTSSELNNPKLRLLIEDGVEFMKNSSETFDVILVDSTDPIGPATPLFGMDFYRDVKSRLTDKGVVVSQCESPFFNPVMQEKLLSIKAEQFPKVSLYNYSNITYPGGFWSFSFASMGLDPILDMRSMGASFQEGLKYYNAAVHKGAFALPQFQRDRVKAYLK